MGCSPLQRTTPTDQVISYEDKMADTPPAPSSEPSTPPSSAADQARIRKERREAKIRAGGSARLNKITGLGGGVQRDAPPQPTVSKPTDDPEEVDISNHYYEPKARSSRQTNPSSTPFAGFPGMGGMPGMEGMGGGAAGEDPMMKVLQQMMGGMPGEGAGGMPSFPGMPPMPGQAAAPGDPYAYLWRIVHAVFALGLGLYIAFATPFTGAKIARERSGLGFAGGDDVVISPSSVHFFWIFATVEVLLQTSRFFFEKGRVQQGGIMGMVMGFLPEPWKGYLALVARYSRIWTTVSGDAMVCVFVLGVCAWLKGN